MAGATYTTLGVGIQTFPHARRAYLENFKPRAVGRLQNSQACMPIDTAGAQAVVMLLEPSEELGGDRPLAEGVVRAEPADGSHLGAFLEEALGAEVGVVSHRLAEAI